MHGIPNRAGGVPIGNAWIVSPGMSFPMHGLPSHARGVSYGQCTCLMGPAWGCLWMGGSLPGLILGVGSLGLPAYCRPERTWWVSEVQCIVQKGKSS